jgi:hypothetical protein
MSWVEWFATGILARCIAQTTHKNKLFPAGSPAPISVTPRKRKQKAVRKTRCKTCVTKTREEGGIELPHGALEQIQVAAITGVCQHELTSRPLCGVQLQFVLRRGISS